MATVFIPATAADFAACLRHRREVEDYSQSEVAAVLGSSQSQVCQWEGGARGQVPGLREAMVWANALGYRVALVPFECEVTS